MALHAGKLCGAGLKECLDSKQNQQTIMGTGGREHGLLIRAVLSGVVGVLFGMLSYFLVIHFIWGGALPCHAVFLGSVPAS